MAVEAGADGARPLGTVVKGRGISTVGKVGGIFLSDNAERSDDDDVMGDEDAGDGDISTGGGAGGGGASGTEGDGHDEPGQVCFERDRVACRMYLGGRFFVWSYCR